MVSDGGEQEAFPEEVKNYRTKVASGTVKNASERDGHGGWAVGGGDAPVKRLLGEECFRIED